MTHGKREADFKGMFEDLVKATAHIMDKVEMLQLSQMSPDAARLYPAALACLNRKGLIQLPTHELWLQTFCEVYVRWKRDPEEDAAATEPDGEDNPASALKMLSTLGLTAEQFEQMLKEGLV